MRADVIVSMAVGVALVGVIVGAVVVAARPAPCSSWPAAGSPAPSRGSVLGVVPLADLGKIAFGAGVGFWLGSTLAELTDDLRIIVVLALAAGVLDTFSVFRPRDRPTCCSPRRRRPCRTSWSPFRPWLRGARRLLGLGTSDVLFFGLYLAAAVGYRLRVRLTLVAMVASLVVTVTVASGGGRCRRCRCCRWPSWRQRRPLAAALRRGRRATASADPLRTVPRLHLSKVATVSMWWVWGNMSTGVTAARP